MISLQVHRMSIYFFKGASHEIEFSLLGFFHMMIIELSFVYLATVLRIWQWVDFHS